MTLAAFGGDGGWCVRVCVCVCGGTYIAILVDAMVLQLGMEAGMEWDIADDDSYCSQCGDENFIPLIYA